MTRAYHFNDVGMFHQKFRLDSVTYNGAGPRELDADTLDFRMKFLCEELQEFMEGIGLSFRVPLYDIVKAHADWNAEIAHAQVFDALIDLVYVAYGTAHLLGYPWEDGWNEVQHANMTKQRAGSIEESQAATGRGSALDVIKPPGWKPPDIQGVLEGAGFPQLSEPGF